MRKASLIYSTLALTVLKYTPAFKSGIKLDKVWISIAMLMLGIVLVDTELAAKSMDFVLESLWELAPFFAATILISAYVQACSMDTVIVKAFGGHPFLIVITAALIGALSPFCSCGVVPLIAALLFMGVPLPAVMAFWLASPLMDPAMFFVTSGILGTGFALAKTGFAVFIAMLGGYGVYTLTALGLFSNPLRPGVGTGGCQTSRIRNPKAIVPAFWQEKERRRVFCQNAVQNSLFLGKWLILAFLLESLMLTYIPPGLITGYIGAGEFWPVVVATLIGIPAYLNGYAALPLVSGLLDQGLQPGAGMAFLIAGGITSIPAAMAVFALVRLPVFLAYVGFALVGAVISGFGYGLVG